MANGNGCMSCGGQQGGMPFDLVGLIVDNLPLKFCGVRLNNAQDSMTQDGAQPPVMPKTEWESEWQEPYDLYNPQSFVDIMNQNPDTAGPDLDLLLTGGGDTGVALRIGNRFQLDNNTSIWLGYSYTGAEATSHGVPWDDDSGVPNYSRRGTGHWEGGERGGPGGDTPVWVVDNEAYQATSQHGFMISIDTSDFGGLMSDIGGGIANGAEAAWNWAADGWHSLWN